MAVYLLGWLGSELTLWVAVIAGDLSAGLALALFAVSFVCTLVAASTTRPATRPVTGRAR
jgi:hypothetical protein